MQIYIHSFDKEEVVTLELTDGDSLLKDKSFCLGIGQAVRTPSGNISCDIGHSHTRPELNIKTPLHTVQTKLRLKPLS
ncbi:hypothetical protein [Sphingobacterium mizutaii]|uniref:hypothetical protein n=1 Tax=Sphingobacterium mizutaii TaxID=1010 RepID=UPI0016275C13|nr:hypothetical protein [Sphingobacterium mizutaii]